MDFAILEIAIMSHGWSQMKIASMEAIWQLLRKTTSV